MKELPKLYTLLEVAAALGLSPHTIRSFVRQSKLSPIRICRRLLFDPEELTKLLRDAKEPQSIAQPQIGEAPGKAGVDPVSLDLPQDDGNRLDSTNHPGQ
jgi:hypothetical protein